MKSFIENALQNGRYILPIYCDGFLRSNLSSALAGTSVVAYSLPIDHSLSEAWQYRMHFDSGRVFEFSSLCTGVGGWEEMGSLCIRELENWQESSVFEKKTIEPFFIAKIECVIYDEANVYCEAGIAFLDLHGKEIVVAAGVAPGSVSISAPFSSDAFDPELCIDDYVRKPI